jgi:hypothetical protein
MAASILSALQILTLSLFSGDVRLDRPLPIGGTDYLFMYDDGSAFWLSWSGLYRGVWFNVQDFMPSGTGASLNNLEFWFYHHSSYPWDTSSFYADLYNGDAAAPVTQLNETSVAAPHYAPCYASYGYPITTEQNFWGLVNSSMSSGGWPSILGDNSPYPADHSFYSDDFIVWIPWVPGSIGLEQATWGSVKALYGARLLGTPGCCDYFIRATGNI